MLKDCTLYILVRSSFVAPKKWPLDEYTSICMTKFEKYSKRNKIEFFSVTTLQKLIKHCLDCFHNYE